MKSYVTATQSESCRKCFKCGVAMSEGYVMDNGVSIRYFCDNDKPAEYDEWYEAGMAWWADWYDEEEGLA